MRSKKPLEQFGNPANSLDAESPSSHYPRSPLQRAFSPGKWWERAARVLGISMDYAFDLSSGRYPMTRRQVRTVIIYAAQKRSTKTSIVKREIAKLERLYQAAEQDWATAESELRAKETEMIRQGKKG